MTKQDRILQAIRQWQAATGTVHPLKCANNNLHGVLEPVIDDDRVLLRCPTCGDQQACIPRLCCD